MPSLPSTCPPQKQNLSDAFSIKRSPAKSVWSILIWHQLSKATGLSLLPACPQRNAKGEARRIAAASSLFRLFPRRQARSATAIFCINAQGNGQQSDRSLKVICWDDCHDQDLSDRLQRGRLPQPDIWLRWGNSPCPSLSARVCVSRSNKSHGPHRASYARAPTRSATASIRPCLVPLSKHSQSSSRLSRD